MDESFTEIGATTESLGLLPLAAQGPIFTPGDKRKKTIAFLLKDRSRYCGRTFLL